MEVYLFKNSQITENQKILNWEENLLQYLKFKDSNFDYSNRENWIKINGTKISEFEFQETFNDLNITNLDLLVVYNFPFIKDKFSFFQIKKIEYLGGIDDLNINGNWKITFVLDLLSTFSILNVINLDKKIRFKQGHLRQKTNFKSNLKLKNNAFVRLNQPIENTEIIPIKKLNQIEHLNSSIIAEKTGIDKWIIYCAVGDLVSNNIVTALKATITNQNISQNDLQILSENFVLFCAPFTNQDIPFSKNLTEKVFLNGQKFYDAYKTNPNSIYMTVVDFVPGNRIYWSETEQAIVVQGSFLTKDGEDIAFALGNYNSNFNVEEINKTNSILNFYATENSNFFEFEETFDSWDLEEENFWNEKQELILNFDPFKKFEIGFFSEAPQTNLVFNLNNQINLNFEIFPILRRKLTASNFVNFNYTDEIGDNFLKENGEVDNYVFGDFINHNNKNLFLPLETEAWTNYTITQTSRNITDFALPTTGAAVGAVVGGPLGAILGASLGEAGTIVKRQSIKNTPNTFKNSALDLNEQLISGYSSTNLTTYIPIESEKKRIAFNFHKFGFYLFEQYFLTSEILFARSRFNFFQISSNENINIFNENLSFIYREEYLKILQSGITFWSFYEFFEDFRKNNIFKY